MGLSERRVGINICIVQIACTLEMSEKEPSKQLKWSVCHWIR